MPLKNRKRSGPIACWAHLSSRSQFMIILGLFWILVGVGVADHASAPMPDAPHYLIPSAIRSIIWCSTGLFAVYAAIFRRYKHLALGLLTLMPTMRICSYAWAWVVSLIPGEPLGAPNGWYSACVWTLVLLAVFGAACLPSQDGVPKATDSRPSDEEDGDQ